MFTNPLSEYTNRDPFTHTQQEPIRIPDSQSLRDLYKQKLKDLSLWNCLMFVISDIAHKVFSSKEPYASRATSQYNSAYHKLTQSITPSESKKAQQIADLYAIKLQLAIQEQRESLTY